jgi:putative membrane protein
MLTAHLLGLVVITNLVVPLGLIALRTAVPGRGGPPVLGSCAAALTLVATVWTWHVPAILGAALSSGVLAACLHATVLLAALLFWRAVFADVDGHPWRALAAVLSAMKAFGLLGVLLVLAPRPVYGPTVLAGAGAEGLRDQNMAGLLFMAASAAGFLSAAVAIVARLLARLDAKPAWTGGT